MNTEKTHARFWEAMRARFGVRWLSEFGDAPTPPWIQLLNQYSPAAVKAAIDLMAEQRLEHPPTLPVFEALLKRASNKHTSEFSQDFSRGYWRSMIVHECALRLHFANRLSSPTSEAFEPYLIYHRHALGEPLRALLNELCDGERNNQGQRTKGLEMAVVTRCQTIIAAHLASPTAVAA